MRMARTLGHPAPRGAMHRVRGTNENARREGRAFRSGRSGEGSDAELARGEIVAGGSGLDAVLLGDEADVAAGDAEIVQVTVGELRELLTVVR